ncbi:tetratricopeptide repeat protein [Actinoplanes nipponensis]|uniref:tetratricopeptide repeat protein n=1 Tax=Actinoplanes nipponensis TaxID=135950 RepID=UPI0034DB2FB4
MPAPVDAPAPRVHGRRARRTRAGQCAGSSRAARAARPPRAGRRGAAPGPYAGSWPRPWPPSCTGAAGTRPADGPGTGAACREACAAGAADGWTPHIHLAGSTCGLRRDDEAETHLRAALELLVRLGEADGQARAHHYLGALREQQGRYREAVDNGEQEVRESAGRRPALRAGDTRCNAVGWHQIPPGRPPRGDRPLTGRRSRPVTR